MSLILKRSLAALKAAGAKYVIIMPDGTVHQQGDLEISTKKKRSKRLYPHGTITKHYMPYIKDLKPNQTVEIPFGQFSPNAIVSGVSSRAVVLWGKGSTVTAQDKNKKVVEVLRVS
jgi:hypothetical protein